MDLYNLHCTCLNTGVFKLLVPDNYDFPINIFAFGLAT